METGHSLAAINNGPTLVKSIRRLSRYEYHIWYVKLYMYVARGGGGGGGEYQQTSLSRMLRNYWMC